MNTFFFLLFTIINFLLVFKVNQLFEARNAFITYGVSLFAVPIIIFGIIYLLRLINFHADIDFKQNLIAIMSTIMMMILLNIVVLFSDVMTNKLLNFQEKNNTANINKNPVRFALDNKNTIKSFYKIFFFIASIVIFYGIWLGKK